MSTVPASPWTARILTLYPAMFPGPLGQSLAGRALSEGRWSLTVVDIRDFARDRHRTVDDTPFGGGPGMVMRPDVLAVEIGLYTVKITHPQVAVKEVRPNAFELSPFENVIYPTFEVR